MTQTAHPELEGIGKYQYGWADRDVAGEKSKRGLNEDVVRDISSKKSEPQWMLDLRLKGLALFDKNQCQIGDLIYQLSTLITLNILFVLLRNRQNLGKIYPKTLRTLTTN